MGPGNLDKGIFVSPACLLLHPSPGVTPTRWSHLSTESLQQSFPHIVSLQQDQVHHPCFTQTSPQEQRRGVRSGRGRIWPLPAQPGVCINPSWSRVPFPPLPVSPTDRLSSHPVQPFPSEVGGKLGEAPHTFYLLSSSLVYKGKFRWTDCRCQLLQVCRERHSKEMLAQVPLSSEVEQEVFKARAGQEQR